MDSSSLLIHKIKVEKQQKKNGLIELNYQIIYVGTKL